MRVSIIMPVYNAEATLQKSLGSIKSQAYSDIELVAVDDCSSDGSLSVLEQFAAESGIATTIVRHEQNLGVATARNSGLDHAMGDYVCWLDADDWFAPDAIRKMVKAIGDSDILGFDWTLESQTARYMRQAEWETPVEAMRAMMTGTMRWNLWMFMVRRSLYEQQHIRFQPGQNMGEDMLVTFRLMLAAKTGTQLHETLYHYRKPSETSVSRTMGERQRREVGTNLCDLTQEIVQSEAWSTLLPLMDSLKLFIKRPLLVTGEKSDFRIWREWMPESNRSALRSTGLPVHTRWLQRMAALNLWVGVKLYHILVYRIMNV